tara:strand:+ start:1249 stop:1695 length:447 start_codon:yes stop_codon:yes gene_type:complete
LSKKKIQNKTLLSFLVLSLTILIMSSFLLQNKSIEKTNIKIKLITSVHKDLPFKFETEKKEIIIKPGEINNINYTVKNLGNKTVSGMATFQVYPSELKDYLTKINCFCYEEQTLKSKEKEKYTLVLLVDPNVTKNIKEAIIQFVFFKK